MVLNVNVDKRFIIDFKLYFTIKMQIRICPSFASNEK